MISFLSGEFFLNRRANGGTVVVQRAIWISTFAYLLVIVVREVLDPLSTCHFDIKSLRSAALGNAPVFGAVFAASYAALYARFASQWTYLAGVYNQIMSAKVRGVPPDDAAKSAMATWEAGFIEDAEDLHLARKPIFAGVILSMLEDPEIRAKFISSTAGGEERLSALESAVKIAYANAEVARKKRA